MKMDSWLAKLGLYRKNTALDGTCLFRAMSELLNNPRYSNDDHLKLRKECVDFMRENADLFVDRIFEPYEDYLNRMCDPYTWGGPLEIEAISLLYKVEFLVFEKVGVKSSSCSSLRFPKKYMLCWTKDFFYDAVYPISYIENYSFCQSIVYKTLYEGVFKIPDVDYAVYQMLHDKATRAKREKFLCQTFGKKRDGESEENYLENIAGPTVNTKELVDSGAILFPYKVAKALDPNTFRNIDFDNWVDASRVPRKNSFSFGNGGTIRVGVKCLMKLKGESYTAHVQSMAPDNGPVLVFVEKIGEKMTVPFDCLEELPREFAKPEWTFSKKHQIISKSVAIVDCANSEEKKRYKGSKQKQRLNRQKYKNITTTTTTTTTTSSEYLVENEPISLSSSTSEGFIPENLNPANNLLQLTSGMDVVKEEPDSTSQYDPGPSTSAQADSFVYPPVLTQPPPPLANIGPVSLPHNPLGGNYFVFSHIDTDAKKSFNEDFSDMNLEDMDTVRFYYNLGIDLFHMGSITIVPIPAIKEKEEVPTVSALTSVEYNKPYKKQVRRIPKKAPRFSKKEFGGENKSCIDESSKPASPDSLSTNNSYQSNNNDTQEGASCMRESSNDEQITSNTGNRRIITSNIGTSNSRNSEDNRKVTSNLGVIEDNREITSNLRDSKDNREKTSNSRNSENNRKIISNSRNSENNRKITSNSRDSKDNRKITSNSRDSENNRKVTYNSRGSEDNRKITSNSRDSENNRKVTYNSRGSEDNRKITSNSRDSEDNREVTSDSRDSEDNLKITSNLRDSEDNRKITSNLRDSEDNREVTSNLRDSEDNREVTSDSRDSEDNREVTSDSRDSEDSQEVAFDVRNNNMFHQSNCTQESDHEHEIDYTSYPFQVTNYPVPPQMVPAPTLYSPHMPQQAYSQYSSYAPPPYLPPPMQPLLNYSYQPRFMEPKPQVVPPPHMDRYSPVVPPPHMDRYPPVVAPPQMDRYPPIVPPPHMDRYPIVPPPHMDRYSPVVPPPYMESNTPVMPMASSPCLIVWRPNLNHYSHH